jgi:phosphopantothenoylcysteine synthetase/decarboxylase
MTIAATSAPVIVAPVMNCNMWNDRAVQRNVQRLRDDGKYIIEPTLIFGAADLATQGEAMYGGHGTLWAGPGSLMRTVSAVLHIRCKDKSELERKSTF